MDVKLDVKLHMDENGDRYGKSDSCPNKCFWTKSEMASVCDFYHIMQVGDSMKEWCSDDQGC